MHRAKQAANDGEFWMIIEFGNSEMVNLFSTVIREMINLETTREV